MRLFIITAALLAAACATAPSATVTAAPVIAAERAFAARAAEIGWVQAFRAYTAPDGMIITTAPVNAPEELARTPDNGNKSLTWWPAYAGISRSGDLGFTTGPVEAGGKPEVGLHYFTVWRRQPDGAWKWIFDGGVASPDPAPFPRTQADVPTLPIARGGAGSAATAIAQVRELERTHTSSTALLALLADDVRINRTGQAPGVGRTAGAALYALPAPDITYAPLRAEASAAGDIVMTINDASWTQDGAKRAGHAVRVWQWQNRGWRIVFDELVPLPA